MRKARSDNQSPQTPHRFCCAFNPWTAHMAPAAALQQLNGMSAQPVYDEASILDLAQSSKLCTRCRAIFHAKPHPEFVYDLTADTIFNRHGFRRPYHSERGLVSAVLDVGCVVCKHLFNSAPARDEFLARVKAEWDNIGPDQMASLFWVGSGFHDGLGGPENGKDKRFFTIHMEDRLETPDNGEYWCIEEYFTVTTLNAPTGFKFCPRPDPAQLPDLVRQWVARCQTHESHEHCRAYQALPRQAPRRVLEITDKALLLLVLPRDNWTGTYITLSHRWAVPEPPKLRRENEAELRSAGISIASLPQVFQDAVQVARWLDVQYVWIDSLCIFQDSLQDWEREAGIMGGIYGGSLFNVAAIDADDMCQSGFLGRLARPGNETLLPVVYSRGNAFVQCLRDDKIIPGDDWPEGSVIHPHTAFDHQVLQSMLIGRGWVHQEILLAPATLYVSQKQAWWHCTAGTSSETYPDGIPPFLQPPDTAELRNFIIKARNKAAAAKRSGGTEEDAESTPDDREETLIMWREVIEIYSKADFTYAPDRLVALAGVVNALVDVLGDYYCGMWYRLSVTGGGPDEDQGQWDDFLSQLIWMHAPKIPLRREALSFEETPQQQQPAAEGNHEEKSSIKTPIIPTWSWASCPQAIRYFPGANGPRTLTHLASRPPFERLNPFGWPMDHAAATLHLRGALVPLCMFPYPGNTSFLCFYSRVSDDDDHHVNVHFDYKEEEEEAEEMAKESGFAGPLPGFYFLPLYYVEQRGLRIKGLVLRERSQPQLLGCPPGRRLFSRVGDFMRGQFRPSEERKWRLKDMPEGWSSVFEDFGIARYRDTGLDKEDLCEDRVVGHVQKELDEIYII
ncbi:hypothetical protein RB597_009932 [Gaeumannomyces tritici]